MSEGEQAGTAQDDPHAVYAAWLRSSPVGDGAAFDHPSILADLQAFDRAFGLPDPPSFVKATPQGVPTVDAMWAEEIALDVEWAHALAPAKSLVVTRSPCPLALPSSISDLKRMRSSLSALLGSLPNSAAMA